MKSSVASSINADAQTAGREAAAKVKGDLGEVKLAFVYGSADYDSKALLTGIAEELPGAAVVGNTSFTGIITPEGFISGPDGFVGIMGIGGDVTVGSAGAARSEGEPRALGARLAKEAMAAAGQNAAPSYFYMAASPAEEEYYLKGITEVIGRVPFFGGSAADNEIAGKWDIYAGTDAFSDGCVIAFFYTDEPFANEFTGAYAETHDVGIVTKMNGDRTIAEIDGVPALEKYADWRGLDISTIMGGDLLVSSIVSPLGVKDRLGDLIAIRHPMNGNDDHTIDVGAKVAENTAVIRMEGSVDTLISSTGETLADLKTKADFTPACFHLVHCGGRRAGIDARIDEVVAQVASQAGETPFIMEFTFGEYGFEDDGLNTTGGLMLSFTALA